MKLEGRTAFITGASRGIGRAIALAFAQHGASVVLGARSTEALESLAATIEQDGGTAIPLSVDVTKSESVEAAAAACAKLQGVVGAKLPGTVDIVVNNAGIAQSVKVLKMDDAHWEAHLDVNLTGTFRVTRAFLPGLVSKQWGRIINIASIAGKVGVQYTAAYCASKHGVIGFTRALALEMATLGVTVNAICPGFVNTDMAKEAARNIASKTGGSEAEAVSWLESQSPQNRLVEPEEVAALAVMLASEDARSINGQAINVDGGSVVY